MKAATKGLLVALVLATGCASDGDPPIDTADYRAFWLATALDRITILRADAETDTCASIRLVSPAGTGGSFGVAAPESWDVEMAGITQGSADCFAETFTAPAVFGVSGSGEVSFTIENGIYYPTELSVDASISFDAGSSPPWVPATVDFTAVDLPVE